MSREEKHNMQKHTSKVLVLLMVAALAGFALADPATPAEALNVTTVATDAVDNLTNMVTNALPWITAAIGLGIVLRWAKRVFKF